jgi:hypothetical protein
MFTQILTAFGILEDIPPVIAAKIFGKKKLPD